MAIPISSNQGLEIIKHTAIGNLFSEIEQEIHSLEINAEEAKKNVWNLEFRICELHRMLDDAIEAVVESYVQKELPLKTGSGVWSVINNKPEV